MNTVRYSCLLLLLGGLLATQAQARTVSSPEGLMAQNTPITNTAPANDAIRRINPNSRQGTGASVPGIRGPSTAPAPRTPTLENREIGNGYPRSPVPARPAKPVAPSLQPRDKP